MKNNSFFNNIASQVRFEVVVVGVILVVLVIGAILKFLID